VRDGTPTVPLLAVFCGALAGFLVFNFNAASIFMGDSGSLFIGWFLASIALVPPAHPRSQLLTVLAGPVLVLLVPILDTSFVAVCRTLAGRRISLGGRDHTSHRLVAIGLSERHAVLLLYGIAAGGGLLAVSMPYASPGAMALLLTAYLLGISLLLVHLGPVRVYGDDDAALAGERAYTPLLIELTYRRRLFEVVLDFLLAGVAYYTAYRLRFEGDEFREYFPVFLSSLPLVLASRTFALWFVGTYRGVWRYFGIADLGTLVRGVALGSAGAIITVVFVFRFHDFSRGVFIIDALLFGMLVAGSRLSFRIIGDYVVRRKQVGRRVVVYGAGDGGALVVRELRSNHRMGLIPVAFIDDDPLKRGKLIHGVPVVGGRDRLHDLLSAGGADEVVISTVKVPPEEVRAVADVCNELQVPVYLARVVFDPVGSVTAVH
jgi:UDP-GlcNAc:undecaprenyl-phosphate/decaprenyl-phosphate GlcNAc-1-phosphate transferase